MDNAILDKPAGTKHEQFFSYNPAAPSHRQEELLGHRIHRTEHSGHKVQKE